MNSPVQFRLAADLVLLLHALFVAFMVLGLLLILLGLLRSWTWIRNPWFRWLHLLGMAVVVLQSWFGLLCPLTTLEMALRRRAGEAVYAGTFIAHWLEDMLYFSAPAWAFATAYTLFGAAVVAGWWLAPPRRFVAHAARDHPKD